MTLDTQTGPSEILEPYTHMTRHQADLLLDVFEFRTTYADACVEHGAAAPWQISNPEKLRLLKSIESAIKNAMKETIPDAATFHLNYDQLQYLRALLLCEYEDSAVDPSLQAEYATIRRLVSLSWNNACRPFKIHPKYRFELRTRGVLVAVYFTEEELRNLARGTHEAVVFNAVVPHDPREFDPTDS